MTETIRCNSCGASLSIKNEADKFVVCTFCGSSNLLSGSDAGGNLKSIKFTYQKNNNLSFEIDLTDGKIILGREFAGGDVLSKITLPGGGSPISRKHCSISIRNGSAFLKDEGSSNGTYYATKRISGNEEQKIENGGIIYLASEPFLIFFRS